jgi:putative hydrolase
MYIIDLHTHTIASGHAYSSLQENVQGAVLKNLQVLGMSEHAKMMPGAPHDFYFQNMRVVPETISGVRILKGIEANIFNYKGGIDVDETLCNKLDYVIASLHPPVIQPGTLEENTQAILRAMDNPYVAIIGHPDDARYPMDYEALIKKSKETRTLIEINNSSLHPKSSRVGARANVESILKLAMAYETPIILGSDAHISFDIGNFDACIEMIEALDFPDHLIVNTSLDLLYGHSKIKKKL